MSTTARRTPIAARIELQRLANSVPRIGSRFVRSDPRALEKIEARIQNAWETGYDDGFVDATTADRSPWQRFTDWWYGHVTDWWYGR